MVIIERCFFEPLPKNRVLRRLGNSQFDDGPGWNFDLLHRLTIVRNTAYTWMKRHAPDEKLIPFDEESHVLRGGSDSAELLLDTAPASSHIGRTIEPNGLARMNPSDTLKIGFVGAGMISQYHLTGWRQARDARVVAICDPDVDKAENRARAFDIPSVFPSMDAMLDATEIDAVDIATPVGTHVSLVTEAADRGIHVMCQKPLAPTVADAKRLIAYVGDRVRFMVHENYRFRPHYVRIRQWLTDGMVGSVVQVRMTMRCSGMVALPGQEPWLLVRQPYLGSMPRLLVFETLIHHLDTVRSLIGELNVVSCTLGRVHAALCGEDVAVIVLKTDTGILAVIDGTFSAPGYPAQVTDRIEIIGTSGTIIFEAGQLRILGRPGVDISYEEPNANTEDQECFTQAIRHFVDGLRSGAPFATDRLDNLKTLELMESCYSAAASHRSLGTRGNQSGL